MITLTVVAFNDTPADGTLQVHFDELGGSIGRAVTNQLVLPDPERMVSRVAAQVIFRNGGFAIVDRGSNPITLNGRQLSSGREAPLASGDRVRICGYELSVKIGDADVAASDPFAGLLGPAAGAPSRGGQLVDPLARQGMRARPAAPAAAAQPGGIPVDWDPFAQHPPGVSKSGAPMPRQRDALGLELGGAAPAPLVSESPSAAQDSLDQLFGLSASGGGDPFANSALDAPMAQPNMAADVDPVRSLKSAPRASAPTEADQLSDLQRPFIPPTIIKPPTARRGAQPVSGAVMSWDADNAASQTSIRARAGRPAAKPAPTMADPSWAATAHIPPPSPAASAEVNTALLEAFRRGLNAPALELPALTPDLMEVIGQLLREAVGGTVELLRARTTVKHELRAEVTFIVPRNNNPLKFSPNAEAALQHLLAPPARGYLAAAPAMREACDDLRAHQVASVAGMKAALEAALQRFDPVLLEGQLGDRSLLHSLLPASRSAKLWEMFVEHYAGIRNDATDEFHALFGKAFLMAYEEQVERFQKRSDPGRSEA